MSNTPHAEELRRQAQERLAAQESRMATLEQADLVNLAHELAVHQMELEIQNEELRRTQLEAQDARDRYLDLYDFAPVGYFTLDEHGRIVEANLTGCRLLRAERQNLLDTHFTKFLLPEETDKFYFHRRNVLEAGVPQTCELKMMKAGGTAFDARLESIRAGGERLRVAVTDVTERKRAEEALRESRQDLDRAQEVGRIGSWRLDVRRNVLTWSDENHRIFGVPPGTPMTYETFLGIVHPDDRQYVDTQWQAGLRGEPYDIEHHIVVDEQVKWVREKAYLEFDEAGELLGGFGITQDITARKEAEETLREWNATLESKVAERTVELEHRARQLQKMTLEVSLTEDRERKRMAEILHDDLQQIIAGAKFHVSLLRSRLKYDASLQDIATQIDGMLKQAVERSRGLSHELSPAVLHHGDFAETLRWLSKQMQAKHGLVVQVRANAPSRLQSEALTSFLYKVVQELLFNVVKHARVNEAHIQFRRWGQCVCVSVSDRGRGFDPQGLREAAGYGLLSIRERLELLGGRMKIRSAEGKGSAFFLVVPDVEKPEDTVGVGPRAYPMSAAPRGHGGPPLRVLLADDHRIVREGLRSLLREEYDIEIVGEAAHGREAVDLALRLEPDVVIMDVSMPLIDGDTATRQIKEHLPKTRVIALSTYNEPETIGKMYRAGAEGYVLKTASSEELLAAIRGRGE